MEEQNTETLSVEFQELRTAVEAIKAEVGKILVGQEAMVDLLITAILSNGHVLIEGVPGVAKTLTAKLISRCISAGFSRLQFTPDLMPSDILGTNVYNFKTSEFEFKQGPIFSNIILIDEINRAPAKTQAALFEVMEERQASIDGKTYKMGNPFIVFATQNPIEHEGTYRLPEAQLDRFIFKIEVKYPSLNDEVSILKGIHERKNVNDINTLNPVITPDGLTKFQQLVASVHVEDNLISFIAEIVNKTRDWMEVYIGGSPRASISILNTSKAFAAINGRDYVTPDDILFVAKPVLRHRIILTSDKEMEGTKPDEVIANIIKTIEVPR
jgi:MoxR-like ATPase